MKTSEFIKKYGEEAWERQLERVRKWRDAHPEKVKAKNRKYHLETNRKGGKYYEKHLEYKKIGLQGERERIRGRHANNYRPYKMIIAPDSEIHHEWVPKTAEYRGMALVEKNPHRYGIIDVIVILDGTITLLTEKEVQGAG